MVWTKMRKNIPTNQDTLKSSARASAPSRLCSNLALLHLRPRPTHLLALGLMHRRGREDPKRRRAPRTRMRAQLRTDRPQLPLRHGAHRDTEALVMRIYACMPSSSNYGRTISPSGTRTSRRWIWTLLLLVWVSVVRQGERMGEELCLRTWRRGGLFWRLSLLGRGAWPFLS